MNRTHGGTACAEVSVAVADGHGLRKAWEWFAQGSSLADLRLHGNVGWQPSQLVVLAVLWVWAEHRNLTGAFAQACRLSQDILGYRAVASYASFTSALRKYGDELLSRLWAQFHCRMEASAEAYWRIGQWLALAVDGSRVSTARTISNERAFAAQNFGKGGRGKSRTKWKNKRRRSKPLCEPVKPQIWLTLIWHMGLKMPWCWKTGPSTACERHHFAELLETQKFPEKTMFCGDAGFTGFELWKSILAHGCQFLMRVGGNVRLLRKLGKVRHDNGLVWLWPDDARRRGEAPLMLRLIECQGPRGKIYLVTSVLSERDLSIKQASQLYRLRWGVELQFRTFKQTFGRRKLRSRTAENALCELDWSLVGLWLIQLFAVKEQIRVDSPPEQSSAALALNVVQDAMRNWTGTESTPKYLARGLRAAVKDEYERHSSKTARYRPHFKDPPSATKPKIKNASPTQRKAHRQLNAVA